MTDHNDKHDARRRRHTRIICTEISVPGNYAGVCPLRSKEAGEADERRTVRVRRADYCARDIISHLDSIRLPVRLIFLLVVFAQ